MSDKLAIHILRRADLKNPGVYARFEDPDRIAPPGAPKLQTLIENPLAGEDDEPAQLIGLKGNLVIGRMDLIAGEIKVGSQAPTRIFWGSHLTVPEAHRNTLMGVMLIMKAAALGATAGAFGPSQAALPIYQKLKWVDLPLTRHILIVRSGPVVRRYVKNKSLAGMISAVADTALMTHRLGVAVWRTATSGEFRLKRLDRAPRDWDTHLAKRTEPVQVHRSADFLNWQLRHRFTSEPRNRNILVSIENRRGQTVGYFVNKVRFHETATHRRFKNVLLGSLQDWMIFDRTALDTRTVLLLALGDLFSRGINAVDFCTADPALRKTLKWLGFKQLGALHLLYKPPLGEPLADASCHDLSRWWIRPGDGDNFFT